eukprot:1491248-Pyramimonas_sp.AAC.1
MDGGPRRSNETFLWSSQDSISTENGQYLEERRAQVIFTLAFSLTLSPLSITPPHTSTMAAVASMIVAPVAVANKVSFNKARVAKAFGIKSRMTTKMMAKVTLVTPSGESVIDCGDDTYILDAAEVRSSSINLMDTLCCTFAHPMLPTPRDRPHPTRGCSGPNWVVHSDPGFTMHTDGRRTASRSTLQ